MTIKSIKNEIKSIVTLFAILFICGTVSIASAGDYATMADAMPDTYNVDYDGGISPVQYATLADAVEDTYDIDAGNEHAIRMAAAVEDTYGVDYDGGLVEMLANAAPETYEDWDAGTVNGIIHVLADAMPDTYNADWDGGQVSYATMKDAMPDTYADWDGQTVENKEFYAKQ